VADRYLLESGAPDGYQLEDASGVVLLELLNPLDYSKDSANHRGISDKRPHFYNPVIDVRNHLANAIPPPAPGITRAPLVFNPHARSPKHQLNEDWSSPILLFELSTVPQAPFSFSNNDDIELGGEDKRKVVPFDVFPNVILWNPQTPPIVNEFFESAGTHKRDIRSDVFENTLVRYLNPVQQGWDETYQVGDYRLRDINLIVDINLLTNTLAVQGTITGTLAYTNNNDTLAASGTTTVVGTLNTTNADDTSAASGTTTITGTLNSTNNDDTSAASGTVGDAVTGTLAYTNNNDTLAASGTTTIVGTLAYTNINDILAASGTTTVLGTLARTNNNDTLAASGTVGTPAATRSQLPLTGAGQT
jgi:hypothetical protein